MSYDAALFAALFAAEQWSELSALSAAECRA
jgi:hypothetical protein